MTEREQMVDFTLHIPIALFEELKRLAVDDLRPLKEELIVLLHEAIEKRRGQ